MVRASSMTHRRTSSLQLFQPIGIAPHSMTYGTL
nr:MAG TPA: hypothetical protein [Caudoviricetes sp.]